MGADPAMTRGDRHPLRVLHLTEGARFAGIEAHLANLVPAQLARGDYVHLATFELGPLSEQMRLIGLEPHLVERAWKYDPQAARRVRELARRFSVRIVHTHGYLADIAGSMAVDRLRRTPSPGGSAGAVRDALRLVAGRRLAPVGPSLPVHVATVHGLPEPFARGAGWKMRANLRLDACALRRADAVVCVTQGVRDYWTGRGVSPDRAVVLPSAVAPIEPDEAVRGDVREELGAGDGDLVVGFVGRLEPVKRAHLLADIAAALADDAVPVVVCVCGDGPERGRLEAAIRERGVANRFRLLGYREDVARIVCGLDALAIVSAHEGVPVALLEAMSAGCVPAAFRVGGLGEAIEDGESGVLVPDGDIAALAGALAGLHADRARLAAMAGRAMETVRERFAPARLAGSLDAVYRSALVRL